MSSIVKQLVIDYSIKFLSCFMRLLETVKRVLICSEAKESLSNVIAEHINYSAVSDLLTVSRAFPRFVCSL